MSAAQFAAEDRRIKEANLAAVATAAAASGVKTGAEQAEETVYRDKKGRKLDMLNEFMRQQAIHEGKAVKEQEEAYEWGKGTAQKRQEAAKHFPCAAYPEPPLCTRVPAIHPCPPTRSRAATRRTAGRSHLRR